MANDKCAVSDCVALAKSHTGLCAVHSVANEGPHADRCSKCRKPIERGEFWARTNQGFGHPSCFVAKPKIKRQKKGWDGGLGALP